MSELAKKILRKAGLAGLIPKKAKSPKTKSRNENLRNSSSRQIYFEVKKYKQELAIFLDKRYSNNLFTRKKHDYLKFLTEGEHNRDKAAIAIGFLCIVQNLPYDSVKKKYYIISGKDVRENLKVELPIMFINLKILKHFIKHKNNLKYLYCK
ncbi:MAG: hypothetical protein WD000_06160 [Thermodesulfobacteriota bacterium]